MRLAIASMAVVTVLAGAGAAAAAVELKDAVARVTVVPEDRADVKVEVVTANPKLPIEIRSFAGTTVIDGRLGHRIRDCHHRSDRPTAWVRGVGDVEGDAIPQLVIRTPKAVVISANGAVFGAVGRSASLELHDSGCSTWTVADVAGDANILESGAGSVRLGAVGRLDLRLSGAADVHAVRVRQGMDTTLSGAGRVQVEDFAGPMETRVSGVGHVRVAGGRATIMRASVSGMGGVEFGGVAETLDARISGIGGIRVKQVTGAVTRSVSGAGHVTIDEGPREAGAVGHRD
ncbi:MAG: putative filamentous hemagglutinin/adhesin [Phenylobacterium sp.]|nr:putative filamentous hemagglutinin/adhesin [Phenylobacterium sp.]